MVEQGFLRERMRTATINVLVRHVVEDASPQTPSEQPRPSRNRAVNRGGGGGAVSFVRMGRILKWVREHPSRRYPTCSTHPRPLCPRAQRTRLPPDARSPRGPGSRCSPSAPVRPARSSCVPGVCVIPDAGPSRACARVSALSKVSSTAQVFISLQVVLVIHRVFHITLDKGSTFTRVRVSACVGSCKGCPYKGTALRESVKVDGGDDVVRPCPAGVLRHACVEERGELSY
jgi:hypothetical protein